MAIFHLYMQFLNLLVSLQKDLWIVIYHGENPMIQVTTAKYEEIKTYTNQETV